MFSFERGSFKSWIAISVGVAFLVIVAQAIVGGSIALSARDGTGLQTYKRSEDPVGFWVMTGWMTLFGIAALLWSGFLRWSW